MKRIIYSGPEEGIFGYGSFIAFMSRINSDLISRSSKEYGELALDAAWKIKHTGIRVDLSYRALDEEGPVTVLVTGKQERISEFENAVLKEHQKLKSQGK